MKVNSPTAIKESVKPNLSGRNIRETSKNDSSKEINFFHKLLILAKTPVEERRINNLQLWSALTPIILGPLALIGLLSSNHLRDPNFKDSDDPKSWKTKFVKFMGKAYQPLFELLTINNLIISTLRQTPARMLTYLCLALYNPVAWKNEWSMIDIVQSLKMKKAELQIKKALLSSYALKEEEKEELRKQVVLIETEISDLKQKAADLNAKIGFFGRVLYNVIMMFSFAYYFPETSRTCQYETEKQEGKVGKFTGTIPSGYTWDHFLNGHKGKSDKYTTDTYLKELSRRFKLEFIDCPREILKEFWTNLVDPKRAQGTLWGKNSVAEDQISKEGNTFLNRWRIRLSAGLLPSLLNLGNIFARVGIISSSLIAMSQYGMSVFNRDSSFDTNTQFEEFKADEANPLGKTAVKLSNSLIWDARMLSGISGLMIAFNPAFQGGSGVPAVWCQGLGGGLSIASALAGSNKSFSSLDLTLQFISTIFFFLGGAFTNLNSGMDKNKELFHRKLKNNIVEFSHNRSLSKT